MDFYLDRNTVTVVTPIPVDILVISLSPSLSHLAPPSVAAVVHVHTSLRAALQFALFDRKTESLRPLALALARQNAWSASALHITFIFEHRFHRYRLPSGLAPVSCSSQKKNGIGTSSPEGRHLYTGPLVLRFQVFCQRNH